MSRSAQSNFLYIHEPGSQPFIVVTCQIVSLFFYDDITTSSNSNSNTFSFLDDKKLLVLQKILVASVASHIADQC